MRENAVKVKIHPYKKGLFDEMLPEELLYTHKMGDNRFAIWQEGALLVHLADYPGRGEVRRTDCPLPDYALLPESGKPYEKKQDTVLYQIDLDNRRVDCGMSYIYALADRRFFILDGGYFTEGECTRLYRFLRSLQGEGTLEIAGWFFSHAHQDHFGCFLDFIGKYGNECVIDTLYYTFPSLALPESVYWKQSDNATMREFDYTLDKYLPDVRRCHLHSGETFTLADLNIEVLFTHEDIYPDRIGSFNDTSTVIRINCGGQSILFLGDLQDASCRKLEKTYGSYLKSDIVQVAHHGFNGSTIETYDLVSPEVALWPTPSYGFEGNRERKVNAHLLAMPSVKEHLIAGIHGTRKLPLPYTAGSSLLIDLPK